MRLPSEDQTGKRFDLVNVSREAVPRARSCSQMSEPPGPLSSIEYDAVRRASPRSTATVLPSGETAPQFKLPDAPRVPTAFPDRSNQVSWMPLTSPPEVYASTPFCDAENCFWTAVTESTICSAIGTASPVV